MKVIILNIFEILYKGEAGEVILPGEDGEFSVLDFHQPFLYRLREGYLKIAPRVSEGEKEKERVFIKDGVARMRGNELAVMVEV